MKTTTLLLTGFLIVGTLTGCAQPGNHEVLLPVPADPTLTYKVWIHSGSSDDPAGKEGLAALTGRMISEGATSANSYQAILEKLYPMAAGYNVRVDKEMTVLTGRIHRDNRVAFLQLLLEAVSAPAFNEDDFLRHKADALNSIQKSMRYSSDEELAKAALYHFVFKGTPYSHPPAGTVAGLSAITLDDVRSFYKQYYNGSNVTLAAGGGYDDEDLTSFRHLLELLPEGESYQKGTVTPAGFEGNHVLLVEKEDADTSISFGLPIDVVRGDRDFYALWVANSWLGEHRNSASHLYQVIREARGMNYGDYSYIEVFPNGGRRSMPPTHVGREKQMFEIWIRTLPGDRAHFAFRAALRELQDLVENGMSDEEFEMTRSFLLKYRLHFATTTSTRLGYAVDDRYYGIDGEGHLDRFRQIMGELTRDEVNSALKKHLTWKNLKIAMVTGDAEALKTALAGDAPSPIVYKNPKPDHVMAEDELISTFPVPIPEENITIVPVDDMFEN
jgi:zinc protease